MKLIKSILSILLVMCIALLVPTSAVFAAGSEPTAVSSQESNDPATAEESDTEERETAMAEEPYAVEDYVYEESQIESGLFPRIGDYSGYDPEDESVVAERKRVHDIIAVIIAVVFTVGVVALIITVKKKKGEKE
ncbi:MAG: hypothetical protein IJ192_02340 [Clostridia bacterium]|nr:hypothetical protein [Clostridia bacterium]